MLWNMLNDPLALVCRLIAVIVALSFHEWAHAFAAYRLGDSTARDMGRMSIDPLRHLDPLGFLSMMLVGFGWAKPVPVNPNRLKHGRWGELIVSIAGVTVNFLLAFVSMVIYKVVIYASWGTAPEFVLDFLYYMVAMNISLGVFNLIPVPPFDGSRIALLFLPQRLYFKAMRYERYIMAAVLLLVFLGALNRPLSACVGAAWKLLLKLTGFVEPAFGIG